VAPPANVDEVSRASRARRIATAAAYGGGGLGALGAVGGAALLGVMFGETKLARRRIPIAVDAPPVSHDTVWTAAGVDQHAAPIRFAMLGDSTAAGYGVDRDRDTPAAQLAVGISEVARRPVHVVNAAVVGAESSELDAQLKALDAVHPQLAVIMIGANDVTSRLKPATCVAHLERAVRVLRARDCQVVVGTCPDLGTIRPLPQPLRAYARRLSRRMAAAQTIAVVRSGGRTVSLGDLLGPQFAAHRELFADDQFHPSAAGYAAATAAVLPSALDALDLETRARSASPFTTRRAKPLAKAAAQAASRPGSEVEAAEPPVTAVRRRGGRFARLRRRRPTASVPMAVERAVPTPDTT
jgi:lysophospholipase L1-like esterase